MAELEQVDTIANPIGERLKTAREAQGLNLDDIAAKTRVPIRHLVHIEKGEWDQLPAPTYSVGFARAYATAVGLDAAEIGTQLRSQLSDTQTPVPAYYEPADPARVPPRWLAMVAAIVAVLLVVGYFVWRSETLGGEETPVVQAADKAKPPATPVQKGQTASPPSASTGPVVLTATDEVWLRVSEADGPRLFEGTLKAGDRYEVPATAKRPQIQTGRPNALQVTVGSTPVAPLGPPETTISKVSLVPADLLAPRQAPTAAAAPSPAPARPRPAPAPSAPRANAAAPAMPAIATAAAEGTSSATTP